ncbi:hypothetical protein LI012_09445 [Caldibacillus thermoamylovorans]|uniref:hypothetical protein n=1 Tax=Caldibacillus thermoamylovorans TaxID=35841 RepID=UPI001D078C0C|nr:hypothetical protein [Caldibacillus thermoamylovorans]MCB5936135.1 hypothetical protein [Bacillus sp. DFI.2.34]MCB7077044.1 hypothetical protein [Caldibacillus thermoamylovorans]
MLIFGDESHSRRRFEVRNAQFWRRALFSSPFLGGKHHFLATKPILVVILRRETLFFGDELRSRHHFWVENIIFWRRAPFSSSF